MAIENLVLPKLGESIMEATIIKWHKQVGDRIEMDETIVEIATDKVDTEVPSSFAGTITEILFSINDVVAIGSVIAKIDTNIHKSANALIQTADNFHANIKETVPFVEPLKAPSPINTEKFYSPLVTQIALNEKISVEELDKIEGTGNSGRVTKKDILNFVENRKNTPPLLKDTFVETSIKNDTSIKHIIQKPTNIVHKVSFNQQNNQKFSNPSDVVSTGLTEIIEMDRVRKIIAKNMVDSVLTSPHVTSFTEVDVTNIVEWRKKSKDLFEKREGAKLTFTPIFMECLVKVIQQYPLLNSSIQDNKIIYKKDINIGMATALENGNLIVPVIKSADQLSIVGLAKAVTQLSQDARNNNLKIEDTQHGTFTLTNVGSFGSLMGTPIILQPQVAILALGAIKKRAVVIETDQGDTIGIRQMMFISLSYDHRIIDGALGTKFIADFAKECANWDVNRQWFKYI
ncbi:MAG: dihydrolipoamide acetyltransferase family protein [Sediminibacterium sp.]|nr:dihydrolipoamide acetyltransferase family protein [Sediminibacterium sp.]